MFFFFYTETLTIFGRVFVATVPRIETQWTGKNSENGFEFAVESTRKDRLCVKFSNSIRPILPSVIGFFVDLEKPHSD